MKDKFRVVGRKLVALMRELKSRGGTLLRKSRDESKRIGSELMERGVDVLRRTPGIKEVLQSTKDTRALAAERKQSLRQRRLEVIRKNRGQGDRLHLPRHAGEGDDANNEKL